MSPNLDAMLAQFLIYDVDDGRPLLLGMRGGRGGKRSYRYTGPVPSEIPEEQE